MDTMNLEKLIQKSVEGDIECSSIICKTINCVIICIYRPPTGDLDILFQISNDILDTVQNNCKNCSTILCEDFNLNLLDSKSVNNESFLTLLQTYDLTQKINEPTRITKLSATLLDNIFINFENIYMVK